MTRQASLANLQQKELKATIRQMFGTEKQFLETFNPNAQFDAVKNDFFCYFGNVPTLAHLNAAYISTTAQKWLVAQIFDLSEFVGVKDKLNENQLRQLAQIIVTQYPYLRVTELMLFFYNFKLGKYAEFYGTVDPLAITKSLREFMVERNVAKYNYERKMEALKEEQDKLTAITYEEYCEKNGIDPTRSIASKVLPSSTGEQPQPKFFKANPKEDNVDEVLKSARGTVDNVYGLDNEGQARMVDAFKKRYGMLPQDYIKKYGKG